MDSKKALDLPSTIKIMLPVAVQRKTTNPYLCWKGIHLSEKNFHLHYTHKLLSNYISKCHHLTKDTLILKLLPVPYWTKVPNKSVKCRRKQYARTCWLRKHQYAKTYYRNKQKQTSIDYTYASRIKSSFLAYTGSEIINQEGSFHKKQLQW